MNPRTMLAVNMCVRVAIALAVAGMCCPDISHRVVAGETSPNSTPPLARTTATKSAPDVELLNHAEDLLIAAQRSHQREEKERLVRSALQILDTVFDRSADPRRRAKAARIYAGAAVDAALTASERFDVDLRKFAEKVKRKGPLEAAFVVESALVNLENSRDASNADLTLQQIMANSLRRLRSLAEQYKRNEDAPGVLMEIATLEEALEQRDRAQATYQYIVDHNLGPAEVRGAKGALNRFQLEGHPIDFSMTDTRGELVRVKGASHGRCVIAFCRPPYYTSKTIAAEFQRIVGSARVDKCHLIVVSERGSEANIRGAMDLPENSVDATFGFDNGRLMEEWGVNGACLAIVVSEDGIVRGSCVLPDQLSALLK